MKSLAFVCALGALLLFAGGALAGSAPRGAWPDLGLLVVVAAALHLPATTGCLAGWSLGVMTDLLSGAPLGHFALLRLLAWAATRVADRQLDLRRPLVLVIFVLALTAADAFALATLARAAGLPPAFGPELLGRLAPHALATAGVAPLVAWLVGRGVAHLEDRRPARAALRLSAGSPLP